MSPAADCIVVGAGVIGLAAALRLTDAGMRVTVIDRGPPGGEASWAAGGILAPQVEAHGPGPLFTLLRQSRALWPAFAAELEARGGIDVGYRADGALAVAAAGEGDDAVAQLEARARWQRAAGLAIEVLSPGDVAALEPGLGPVRLALRTPDDHQVDSRQVVAALVSACRAAGVEIARAEVRGVRATREPGAEAPTRLLGVELDDGPRAAGHVVIAAGAWSAQLPGVPLPAGAVVPVRGQMIELRTAAPPPLRHVVFGAGGYLVPRSDGRVLCGSTEEHVGFAKEVTAAAVAVLSARAARLCPALGTAPQTARWAGLRPASADALPYVGTSSVPGLHLATGHFRNGMLLAPLTAAIVAALVTGAAVPVDVTPLSPTRA